MQIVKIRESFISLETREPQMREYDTVVADESEIEVLIDTKLNEFKFAQKGFYHVVDAYAPTEDNQGGRSFRRGKSKEEYLVTDALRYEENQFKNYGV